MEEVDKIIIESLRNLECDIGVKIKNLKQFDADMVTGAVSSCLEAILHSSFPKKLPPSMSARLKLASNMAEQIKDLGFREDMGYQSILYYNEEEVRRVLIFLIERLPRETIKTVSVEQIGYVSRIVKTLEDNIKESLSKTWVPSCFLRQGVRETSQGYIVNSLGDSCSLRTEKLDIPDSRTQNEELKYYWIHNVPDVTKQCSHRKLIPSLLYKDSEFPEDFDLKNVIRKSEIVSLNTIETDLNIPISSSEKIEKTSVDIINIDKDIETRAEQSKIDKLSEELENKKSQYILLQDKVKTKEALLKELIRTKNEEQNYLIETLAKVKLKTKTQTVLSKEENLAKLNNMIEKANDRLAELAKQWHEIQTPLLEEYKCLKDSLTSEESKYQEQKEKLENFKETEIKLNENIKEKKDLSQNLTQQYKQINRKNNRAMYTRRILEIISNIRKQNNDIQKVLKDTREIQKEIKNLTGQVDRSFTLADELIFYDAKNDETARRSYKLLAALRDEFNIILKTLEDLGVVERECRNLEEQIEIEKSKEVSVKLERVISDLRQIQKETDMMKKPSS
ncbi:unnamed protein product [Psylliodes chrysocephalus]|uniref:Coiled-coil domain-containing protein 22 homolog n=1 Tax=Psylliodes chrysocephalus TaxID=3402493 RepID=A0A9P0GE19_9CUCU|nr:unnamed protein product [Psylliodes chrysocephala]